MFDGLFSYRYNMPLDFHYRLALCMLAMPPLCQILNTPLFVIEHFHIMNTFIIRTLLLKRGWW